MFWIKSFTTTTLGKDGVNDKELFDIIGRIVEIFYPIEKMIGGKASRLMDFVLEDVDCYVEVCLAQIEFLEPSNATEEAPPPFSNTQALKLHDIILSPAIPFFAADDKHSPPSIPFVPTWEKTMKSTSPIPFDASPEVYHSPERHPTTRTLHFNV
nr:replication factor A protein 1-like [Ipomoea batatas]